MLKKLIPLPVFVCLFFVVRPVLAQAGTKEVSFCDLANHPKSYDGKTIRVRGTASVHFEDFSLFSKDCKTQQDIWLAFGGDVPGLVASTANDTFRKPDVDIKVNGVPYGIKKDENFRRFYALVAARHGDKPAYQVTATLTGAFFAGEEHKLPNGQTTFMGYGHLGCCALLVITQVSDVESIPQANLDVRGSVLRPDGKPAGGFVVVDEIDGGSPPEHQQTTTNESGDFEFADSGPLLRFENPRYRPLAVAVEPGGAPVHVRLEDAKQSDWIIPSCQEAPTSARRIGFSALFTLPGGLDFKLFTDENHRSYFIFPRGGDPYEVRMVITASADPTTDAPGGDVFVDSSWSKQRWIKNTAGGVIGIDSRGRSKHGDYWRTAIFLGHDSAGYRVRSGKSPNSLNKIINSACIVKR